tara:strand:+ start:2112 stop:4241 length:2130 start_codon:yes stop_codon:yes gene_type:complete
MKLCDSADRLLVKVNEMEILVKDFSALPPDVTTERVRVYINRVKVLLAAFRVQITRLYYTCDEKTARQADELLEQVRAAVEAAFDAAPGKDDPAAPPREAARPRGLWHRIRSVLDGMKSALVRHRGLFVTFTVSTLLAYFVSTYVAETTPLRDLITELRLSTSAIPRLQALMRAFTPIVCSVITSPVCIIAICMLITILWFFPLYFKEQREEAQMSALSALCRGTLSADQVQRLHKDLRAAGEDVRTLLRSLEDVRDEEANAAVGMPLLMMTYLGAVLMKAQGAFFMYVSTWAAIPIVLAIAAAPNAVNVCKATMAPVHAAKAWYYDLNWLGQRLMTFTPAEMASGAAKVMAGLVAASFFFSMGTIPGFLSLGARAGEIGLLFWQGQLANAAGAMGAYASGLVANVSMRAYVHTLLVALQSAGLAHMTVRSLDEYILQNNSRVQREMRFEFLKRMDMVDPDKYHVRRAGEIMDRMYEAGRSAWGFFGSFLPAIALDWAPAIGIGFLVTLKTMYASQVKAGEDKELASPEAVYKLVFQDIALNVAELRELTESVVANSEALVRAWKDPLTSDLATAKEVAEWGRRHPHASFMLVDRDTGEQRIASRLEAAFLGHSLATIKKGWQGAVTRLPKEGLPLSTFIRPPSEDGQGGNDGRVRVLHVVLDAAGLFLESFVAPKEKLRRARGDALARGAKRFDFERLPDAPPPPRPR